MPGFGHLINISGQIDEYTDAIEDLITKIPHKRDHSISRGVRNIAYITFNNFIYFFNIYFSNDFLSLICFPLLLLSPLLSMWFS